MRFKNILFYGIAAVLIFAPLARGAVRLWSITPVLLIIYLLIFLWLWRLNNQEKLALAVRKSPLDTLIFLFVVLALISSIFSIYKHESLNTLLRVLAFVGFYYLVLNNFDEEMRNRLLGLVVGLSAVLSLYGLLQYFTKLGHSWWDRSEFLSATYVNHNHFAGFLELVIPVAIGTLASHKLERFYRRLGLGVIVAILMFAFVLTQSRAGWASLGVSLLIMNAVLVKKNKGDKKNLFVFIMILIVIFGFSYIHREVLSKRIGTMTALMGQEKEASFASRLEMWKASIKMVRNKPFVGVGLGAFDAGFYQYRPQGFDTRAGYAHNDYLQMAAEMGILSPLLMIGFLFVLLKKGLKKDVDLGILGCAIGVLSLALHGFVDFNFHIPANMLLLTVYAAFIMQVENTNAKTKEPKN
jgi:O-antigen ligase